MVAERSLRIQLWSYNYDPEPTGIGPLATVWSRAMQDRGHEVSVVAAHPHYPEPLWGKPLLPRREMLNGIRVLRLPLWAGRTSTLQRLRQEITYAASLTLATPWLGSPDVIVAVSPSFPALAPAMAAARSRRVPWVLWLQDILPDGATATGLLDDGTLVKYLQRFELAAYRSAARVVVISDSFRENLLTKGVSRQKIVRIFNPASLPAAQPPVGARDVDERLLMTMGNIGHTQNLAHVVRAFESCEELRDASARFVIAGDGVAAYDVRAALVSDRVKITGVLSSTELKAYLNRAALAVVSQQYAGRDFNVPSKLMNFMAFGLPTLAAVRSDSEVARIVHEAQAGWVENSASISSLQRAMTTALRDREGRRRRGAAAWEYARRHFNPPAIAGQFERVLYEVTNPVQARG